ncbi:hypothetical protein O0L34_g19289 [Tuta absoluta]|nr:hypothetical protein O0L34_g19289 [Tuta absoluta]
MKVHQVYADKRAELKHRILSCFCKSAKRGFCTCFNPQTYTVHQDDDHTSSEDDLPHNEEENVNKDNRAKSNKENDLQTTDNFNTDCHNLVLGPSTSYVDGQKVLSAGDFLHVYVHTSTTKNKIYSYVCKALTDVEEDSDLKVMFLRVVTKDAKRFRLDEKDICYISYDDVIKILPAPAVIKRGHRTYYEFKTAIDVFEE